MASPSALQHETTPRLPQRYKLRGGGGEPTHIVCDEAPRVKVQVRRDFAFSLAEAKELGERVILLDGAGTFGPLLDNKRRLYNLDHHQGCERTFTLATCEQALLMVTSGLDLGEGDWRIFANEPDLDTVLALWCLLNHVRLRELRPEVRDILYPLIRLEGAIDANGTELAEVCGLPKDVYEKAQRRLGELLEREKCVKGGGDWQTLDLDAYTIEMLGAIDRIIYSVEDFRGYASIDEVYGHVEIGERSVAILCRDDSGIYAVEKLLKERWGEQLGVIALEREPGHYTLRRASTLADIDLNDAYSLLNQLDRNVDGRPPGKRWGGSESIGGSPRQGGSTFGPSELLQLLGRAFEPTNHWQRLRTAAYAASLTALIVGLGAAAAALVLPNLGRAAAAVVGGGILLLGSALASHITSERRMWLYGWRRPGGARWLLAAVFAAPLAIPLRGLFPAPESFALDRVALSIVGVAVLALAVEACFRGLVYGLLLRNSRLPGPDDGARITYPAAVSALLYAIVATGLCLPAIWNGAQPLLLPVEETALVFGAAFGGGLLLAHVRERSLSLWPGAAAQLLGGIASAGLAALLLG
ncbi:MAG: hypothetical protein JRF15_12020 [Deltaproteobacteria bacterium]|jgi:hypothetical protein|nr:hypothetical protein [Deltaproteobacteria bacterium]